MVGTINDTRIQKVDSVKRVVGPAAKMVSLSRGFYARVAHKVGCDVSYVSRIARGERQSAVVETTLKKEFRLVIRQIENILDDLKKTRNGEERTIRSTRKG